MDLYWLTLGGVLGALGGAVVTLAAASVMHDRDRRHADRFRSAAALARCQHDEIQSARAGYGPCAQDWLDLYDELQPHEVD